MKKLADSFRFAMKGLRTAFAGQQNLRIHIAAALVVMAAGFRFDITVTEWCILGITIAVVISAELFNTALEYLVDLVSPEKNPVAGKVKDIAAGAVLVTAIMAVVVGILIFGKYIFK